MTNSACRTIKVNSLKVQLISLVPVTHTGQEISYIQTCSRSVRDILSHFGVAGFPRFLPIRTWHFL